MLQQKVIDRIWARMLVRYGAQWLRMWEAPGDEAAKTDWANELSVYANNLDAIVYGLENLPLDFPPNAMQFKAICNRRPDAPAKRLEAPPPNRERVASVMQRLAEQRKTLAPQSSIERLRKMRADGEKLTAGQKSYLEAVDAKAIYATAGVGGDFNPIPRELWPEAMRKEL